MADDNTPVDPVAQFIGQQASAAGPDYVRRLFAIESGGDPNAVTGSNRGLAQFGPAEEAQYGINDANRTDPNAQAAAVLREAMANRQVLAKALGRDPTAGELYLTHQQGQAGGPALLTADADMPAWQAIRPYYRSDRIAKQAITGNIPSSSPLSRLSADDITAGAFRDLWTSRFAGAPTANAGSPMAAFAPVPAGGTGGAFLPPPGAAPAGTPEQSDEMQQAAMMQQLAAALAPNPLPAPSMTPMPMVGTQGLLNNPMIRRRAMLAALSPGPRGAI